MNDLITQPGFCETPHSPVTTSAKEPVLKPNSSRAQSSWLESESFSSHMMFSLVSSPTTSSEFASLAEQRSLMQSIVGEYGIWKKEQWTQKRNKLTNMKSVKKRSSRIELLHGFGLQVDPAIEVGRHVAFEVWSCQCPTHRLPRTRGIIGSVSSSLGLTYGSFHCHGNVFGRWNQILKSFQPVCMAVLVLVLDQVWNPQPGRYTETIGKLDGNLSYIPILYILYIYVIYMYIYIWYIFVCNIIYIYM